VTDQQPKLGEPAFAASRELSSQPDLRPSPPKPGGPGTPVRWTERRGRTSAEAIKAGLNFLSASWQEGYWQDSPLALGGSDVRVTSCVLARLSELPTECRSHSLQRKIESSLDWLTQSRSREGSWGSRPGEDDANSTAWAILALCAHGRAVPAAALDFLLRCRQFDGGFASIPAGESASEITAVAVRAVGQLDWATEDFLSAYLRSGAASPGSTRRSLRFHICAEILDWPEGLASATLLNQVRQIAAGFGNEGAIDRALLLRCLLRLRMQRAWSLAAGLRAMQMDDGSWSEHEAHKILATVTAVSALVLGECQPGLCFGSDLPLPRRLHQS
jgi:hypothetical protein